MNRTGACLAGVAVAFGDVAQCGVAQAADDQNGEDKRNQALLFHGGYSTVLRLPQAIDMCKRENS